MGLGVLQLVTGAHDGSCPVGSGSWQDRGRGAERVHSWQSQPTRARQGPSGLPTPLGPLPLLCSQPKSSFFSPLKSPWRPGCLPGIPGCSRTLQGEFPRPPEGSGHSHTGMGLATGIGEGTCTPQPPWPHPYPLLFPPSSQHEGNLPGALTAQQVEEQSAAPCCQHAEAGEPPCRSCVPHLRCHIHLPPHGQGGGQPMGDTQ